MTQPDWLVVPGWDPDHVPHLHVHGPNWLADTVGLAVVAAVEGRHWPAFGQAVQVEDYDAELPLEAVQELGR